MSANPVFLFSSSFVPVMDAIKMESPGGYLPSECTTWQVRSAFSLLHQFYCFFFRSFVWVNFAKCCPMPMSNAKHKNTNQNPTYRYSPGSFSFFIFPLLQASERRPINSLCRPFVSQQRLPALVARPDALIFEELAFMHQSPTIRPSVSPPLER